LQKKYNFILKQNKMDLAFTSTIPLPLDQFRFNLVLRILITAYGASGIWNFFAFVPWCSEEDAEILWYRHNTNYSFWLISSLLFCVLWISQFRFPCLIYITTGEIYLILVIYICLLVKKHKYSKRNKTRIKQINKKRFEDFSGKTY